MKFNFKEWGVKFTSAFEIRKVKASSTSSSAKGSKARLKVDDSKKMLQSLMVALILVLFTAEFAFAITIYVFKVNNTITNRVAAIVPYPAAFTTSGVVTVSKYWKEKKYIEHFYASTKQEAVNSDDLSAQILKQEAENEIIAKEAIQFKISVSSKEVDDSMNQIYQSNGGQEEVEKALQDLYGLNVSEFKDLVRTQLLRDSINKEVIKHVTVRHILIRVDEGAAQDKVDEAKARITGYLNEIKNGTITFEDAAKKYSEDVGSNQDGGLLESFGRGDMVKEFEDVAFATKTGEISEPFRTSFGWHILKVESSSGYIDKSFDDWLASLMKNNLVIYLYKDRG